MNVIYLLGLMLDLYFFVSSLLPTNNPQPDPEGGHTLCFAEVRALFSLIFAVFYNPELIATKEKESKEKTCPQNVSFYWVVLLYRVPRKGVWVS